MKAPEDITVPEDETFMLPEDAITVLVHQAWHSAFSETGMDQGHTEAAAHSLRELLEIVEEFPDMQDGRSSPEELREAASNWYWDRLFPLMAGKTNNNEDLV